MFEDVLKIVKEHLGSHPEVTEAIPADQVDDVHREVASQVTDHLKDQSSSSGGLGGMLGTLGAGLSSGSTASNAIEGGLVSSLGSKFGLSPMVTGAIAASLPAIIQKFLHSNKTAE